MSSRSSSVFEYVFRVPLDHSAAFQLFSDPRNLNLVTPRWFHLVFLDDPPAEISSGVFIDYRLRWRFWTLRWRSVVTDWQPPRTFTYEQGRGPYRYFRHEHHFAAEVGGTNVTDRVLYRAPGGPLVERLVVRPDLERIFAHRERAVLGLLADPSFGDSR